MSEQVADQQPPSSVECRATKDPSVRRFILAAILLGLGAYCFVDHYVLDKYPYPEDGPSDINAYATYLFNHYGPFVLIPPGIVLVVCGALMLRRRLVADQEGIGYVGKQKVPWTAVRSLDTAKLANKGILRLRYDAGDGDKTLVLDSWKLQDFRELVKLVEQKVPPAETK